jgi:hypothetical protein
MHPRISLLAAGLFCVPAMAFADPQGLSTDVPVQVQDAYVVRLGTFELQGGGVYTNDSHNSKGRDLLNLTPEMKLGGPVEGMEVILAAPYAVGDQSGANQGGGALTAQYQFNKGSASMPAFLAQVGYETPYGAGHHTASYHVEGVMTQRLGDSDAAPRLHLDLFWTHRNQPDSKTRFDQLGIGIAYSMLVRPDTALVMDVVHEAKPAKRQVENIVDVGFRHEITSDFAVSFGAGVGIAEQSPDFRILFAIQQSFQAF